MRLRAQLVCSLVVGSGAAVGLWLAVAPPRVHDYIFQVSGTVVTHQGTPLVGVHVILEVAAPVYEAITPLTRAETVSDEKGHFAFSYISCGAPAPPYILRFRKPGFGDVVIHGDRETIRVRRVRMQALAR